MPKDSDLFIFKMSHFVTCTLDNGTTFEADYTANNASLLEDNLMFSLSIFCSTVSAITIFGNVLVLLAIMLKRSLRNVRSNTFIASLGKVIFRFIFSTLNLIL